MKIRTVLVLAWLFVFSIGCANQQKPMTVDQKRTAILEMQGDTLAKLYQQRPSAKGEVSQAPGYAVFSDEDMPVLKMGESEGYGAVFDNSTHLPTYMQMTQLVSPSGAMPQLKQYRLVFVFRDRVAMNRFVKQGWQFGADTSPPPAGDATAFPDGIKVYQLTHDGVNVRSTVPLTKYWQFNELN